MPLGNGDLGMNVWVESNGDLLFYLSKTDAWDEQSRLLKLGRIRVKFSPNPFIVGQPFRQELKLRTGEIEIRSGDTNKEIFVRIWVDANRPVIHVETTSKTEIVIEASLENWRKEKRALTAEEMQGVDGLAKNEPAYAYPDTVMTDKDCCVTWYHRNTASLWPMTLRHQDLGTLESQFKDPLMNRTFGASLSSEDMPKTEGGSLKSYHPGWKFHFTISALTVQTATAGEWHEQLEKLTADIKAVPLEKAREEHQRWWQKFWQRSYVHVTGTGTGDQAQADLISQSYALQRFMNACAGRGGSPIKFNGSIFTVDVIGKFDADYRRWGGCYWFQNTRLPYWPMLASGDFDLMQPLFHMYQDALPFARARTPVYFQHAGAFFPETMYFWGAYHNGDMGYGWDRQGKPLGISNNQYIRYYQSGGIELLAMMLEYFAFTEDHAFCKNSLLPFATDILLFYDCHYPRDAAGKIRFEPAQSLETWWECVNPLPELAGLRFVLEQLQQLPGEAVPEKQRNEWKRLLSELPPVPLSQRNGKLALAPAENFTQKQNQENPELYAIFPYRLYGQGKPGLDIALTAYANRQHKGSSGWQQDDIQAAFLGLSDEATRLLVARLSARNPGSRFPVFWGPNFDWVPDQDHGCAGMMALQIILLQYDGRKIQLFPAWPKDWDVTFKLNAPYNTVVEGTLKQGRLEHIRVTPEIRARDVVNRLTRP